MSELVENKDKIEEYKKQARELTAQLTLEEKVFQMLHNAPAIERLNIKAYNWWNEGLHGVARAGIATMFPQAIGLAAAFDEEMMEEVGDAVATEGRAKFNMQQEFGDTDIYKGLTFWAPNVNIFRDPRWGRGHETYGEDPYLTSRLGVRFVQGLQGHDESYLKAAACAKHFAVHSGPEDLRHSFDARVTEKDLNETYLPAFKALVQEAKVETVMGAYNRTNGEPCCGSSTLLKDILRDKWGFDGHIVSDCWAIKDFHENHRVTEGPVDSVALAVENGCDLNCGNMFFYLLEAVKQGKISEEQIDQAVTRLFTTRIKLGLLGDHKQVPFNDIPYEIVDSDKYKQLNLSVAKKSLVLLKNQNQLLPLNKADIKTIGIIGPNANNRKALEGNYEGTASRYVTILEGFQDYLKDDVRVLTSVGCHLHKDRISGLGIENDRIAEVKGVCKASDVIIACMGLDSGLEGEEGDEGNEYASGDKPHLNLPGLQEEVLKTICESGKPVILVLLSGSALAINWAEQNVNAIVQGWYPGALGGQAVAELVFGECVPEGKLPVTFYRTTEELPDFTDYSMENRTYRYMKNEALFPFGYGLSYTNFIFSDLTCNCQELTPDGAEIGVTIKNVGNYAGRETVQVYVKVNCENTPNPQLKAFAKAALQPGEEKRISFHLPADAFSLYDDKGTKRVLDTTYTIFVGGSQPDARSIKLTGKKPLEINISAAQRMELE
ncbi:glycoside hydrolase family 3 N-terminal domain-containing protein [Anaeromicropila populeti]|uniref:Beta-glucosidase n=1 Tax=Anaeromicropila populeti TaxID=37658 RepID=A0A1I6JHF4_9FIRM|nr:glycoside hydrolase family 3 N-terminal domain-containing protein [Anaeromicropila populeti]SFR78416.1 beta-glucosidase [Anaeromicropila populeti]